MTAVKLVIFDLDNTLYDWYRAFLPAFYSMVDEASRILQLDRESLLDELKSVHVKHRDVEHPFALFETEAVQSVAKAIGSAAAWRKIDPAFHAYNRVRKQQLELFPDVLDTLQALRRRGIELVAYTDSKYFAALGRMERLEISDCFSKVYCRERAKGEGPKGPKQYPAALVAKMIQLPANELKPNPTVLLDIAAREKLDISSAAYVGDSITKDVLMAKRAGCFSVWAKYGAHTDPEMYAQLVRISHWTEDEIASEVEYGRLARNIAPDFVCERSIAELLPALEARN